MNINFEYYKIFYIIAKNKNITKAANELNISQPAISRMLKTMEDQMNTKLFIRKTKGVILTNEGKELYRLIADNIDNIMKSEISFSKIINNKTLKIAGNKTYINYLITNNKLDNIFKSDSSLNIIDTNNFDLLNSQLSNNLVDFAFITEPTNYQFNDELVFKPLNEFHLVYASKQTDNKTIVILNNKKFIDLSKTYLQSKNISAGKFIQVDDYDSIYPLISNGYANGFLIKEYINSYLENNEDSKLNISDDLSTIKIGILYNINNELKIKKYFNI
ncbi:transcriptional regulator [Clostridium sp. CAG:417]|nr:transcriptional regulator [Clostridium sp. CAG:417]